LRNYKKPIIGYIGAIAEWLDKELIEKIAKEINGSIILIGMNTNYNFGANNIYCLGEKRYDDLINYICDFSICIIPFKELPITKTVNPVKMYEYLAAGKKIISTNFEGIRKFSDYIIIAKDHTDFINKLKINLQSIDLELEKRLNFARKNTWEERINQLREIIK